MCGEDGIYSTSDEVGYSEDMKPKEVIYIPDDLTGEVIVRHGDGTSMTHEFIDGVLQSVNVRTDL